MANTGYPGYEDAHVDTPLLGTLIHFVRSGSISYNGGNVGGHTINTLYWHLEAASITEAGYLNISPSYLLPQASYPKSAGFSIRCFVR